MGMTKEQIKFETELKELTEGLNKMYHRWLDSEIPEWDMWFKVEMMTTVYGRKLYENRMRKEVAK